MFDFGVYARSLLKFSVCWAKSLFLFDYGEELPLVSGEEVSDDYFSTAILLLRCLILGCNLCISLESKLD